MAPVLLHRGRWMHGSNLHKDDPRRAVVRTRILVADDNPDSLAILGLILEHRGYDVATAVDGEEAVRQAREHRPDLILMDLQMPRLSGLDAAHTLKEDAATSHIPILAVTASTIREDIREYGFCGILRKPVLPRQVMDAVDACCGAGAAIPDWLEVDGLPTTDGSRASEPGLGAGRAVMRQGERHRDL